MDQNPYESPREVGQARSDKPFEVPMIVVWLILFIIALPIAALSVGMLIILLSGLSSAY